MPRIIQHSYNFFSSRTLKPKLWILLPPTPTLNRKTWGLGNKSLFKNKASGPSKLFWFQDPEELSIHTETVHKNKPAGDLSFIVQNLKIKGTSL